jgi:catechol 2,3-dioxygenase-like lactoylglutathione lyase family enzyme
MTRHGDHSRSEPGGSPRRRRRRQRRPTPPTGIVVGSGNFFSPIVADLDKAIAFYREGLGLDVTGAPANADTNAPLRNMFGVPEAQLRWTVARPAAMRTGVEIVEIGKIARKPVVRRIQDPGAFTLIATVRDVDALAARLLKLGGTVVTKSGAPIPVPMRTGTARGDHRDRRAFHRAAARTPRTAAPPLLRWWTSACG